MSRKNAPLYLNVYEVNRAYGGPEEGGWWYDYGIFLGAIKLRRSEKRLRAVTQKHFYRVTNKFGYPVYRKVGNMMKCWHYKKPTTEVMRFETAPTKDALEKWTRQALIDFAQYDDKDHPLSSVICDGKVKVYVESTLGKNFPSERPHYE